MVFSGGLWREQGVSLTLSDAQDLTHGSAQGSFLASTKPRLATCKASVLLAALLPHEIPI